MRTLVGLSKPARSAHDHQRIHAPTMITLVGFLSALRNPSIHAQAINNVRVAYVYGKPVWFSQPQNGFPTTRAFSARIIDKIDQESEAMPKP